MWTGWNSQNLIHGIRAHSSLTLMDTSFMIIYFSSGAEVEAINSRVGLMCCMGSIIFCAAPLISLTEVFRTQCTEVLPFPLIMSTFFVTGLWWLYGIIIQNSFVQYPNLIGCCLASFQLLLFIVYPSKRKGNWPQSVCRLGEFFSFSLVLLVSLCYIVPIQRNCNWPQ